ncbi:hypothetical protein ACQ86N_01685 [Puia sp. P3]|uniref:hypothetical protein n=1 Tax=Puia sp. P3 TaxID=3423952 RepID=UPI003D66F097
MLEYNEEILAILRPRMPDWALEGYYGGMLSPDKTRLIGYTWQPVDRNNGDSRFFNNHETLCGGVHSSIGADTEQMKVYHEHGTWSAKGLEACIKEGIYTSLSLGFTGALHEGKWYIRCRLTFFGRQIDEAKAKAYRAQGVSDPDYFKKGAFAPYSEISSYTPRIRQVEYEEYPDLPSVVSHALVEEKEKVNRAFSTYMNLAFVRPFFQRLRIRHPEDYVKSVGLFAEDDFTLIFPAHKKYFLAVAMVEHQQLGWRLVWFFFDTAAERFYRWKLPTPQYHDHSYFYAEDIIEDLKAISNWDDYRFLNSSRTLDEDLFWQEYVLKKEKGEYLWLEPVVYLPFNG